mgnify:FL=1
MFPLTVTIIPPVNTPANYILRFSTLDGNMSTCGVKITRVGSSFPCGIQAINTTLGDSSATIDLGVVASYGKTFKRCIAESLIIFLRIMLTI